MATGWGASRVGSESHPPTNPTRHSREGRNPVGKSGGAANPLSLRERARVRVIRLSIL